MKLLKSNREIELVSDFDTVNKYPCVTVEKWNKWYSLYLVTEDFKVFNIEHEIYGETSEPSIFTKEFSEAWYDDVEIHDHSWKPLDVLSVLDRFDMYMGKSAYEALVMMWVEQHGEEPGFECDYIPSKELYDKVIVPDNGDIDNCNSFTPEERTQFKFYKEDERSFLIEITREFKELSEKYNIPIITSNQIPDEDSSDLLQTEYIYIYLVRIKNMIFRLLRTD